MRTTWRELYHRSCDLAEKERKIFQDYKRLMEERTELYERRIEEIERQNHVLISQINLKGAGR